MKCDVKNPLPDERGCGTKNTGVPPAYFVRQDGAQTGASYLAEDQSGGDPGDALWLSDQIVLQQLGGEGGGQTNIKPIEAVK